MDPMFVLSLVSRWIHVGTAVVLVGGLFALRFVVHPVLAGRPEDLAAIRGRWKKYVHGGIALLLLTGAFNYWRAIVGGRVDGIYHAMIDTKILLAMGSFFLSSALVGRSAGTQKFRDAAPKWAGVVLLLGAVIIALSGVVKVRDNAKQAKLAATTAAASAGNNAAE